MVVRVDSTRVLDFSFAVSSVDFFFVMSKNPKLPLLHQLHLCIGQKAKEELGI